MSAQTGINEQDLLARFKAFDAAADAEAAQPAPATAEQMAQRLTALIDKLPQRAAIKHNDAARWLERTSQMAVERMELEHGEGQASIANVFGHVLWHIRRASGFGGSDAATIVKHYRGKRGTFGDAHSLVKEKLLILSPQPSTEEMSRGIRAEPWIQRIFHEQEGIATDKASLQKLRGFRWDKRPASVGTPDDIVLFEQDGGAIRELIDYKAPSAKVMEDYDSKGISFDYVCQLHHYLVIAMASGIRIDRMSIRALDPRGFRVVPFEVPYDKELAREIVASSHKLWTDHVMTADIPVAPRPDDLPILDEALVEIGVQAAFLKVLEDDVAARKQDLCKRISAVSEDWHDVTTGRLDLKVGTWSRDRVWDEETLVGIAKSAGVDPKLFLKPAKKGYLDPDKAVGILRELHQSALGDGKQVDAILQELRQDGLPIKMKLDLNELAEALEAQGHSLVTAARVKESLKLSQKKSGEEFERLARVRGQVSEMAEAIETAFAGQAMNIIEGKEEVEDVTDAELGIA